MLNIAELEGSTRGELIRLARELGVSNASTLRKRDLIFRLLQTQAERRGRLFSGGFLEVSDDGNYGFLRGESLLPGPHDIYVSQSNMRRFALRPGDYVAGQIRSPRDNEKYYGLLKVEAVNGLDPEAAKRRPFFENLTAVFPNEQLRLETTPENLTHRLIDLIAPIGRGQRALIVSPPKAGKTMLLQNIANGITTNHPDIHLMVVLIGERPEEVTDMRRSVRGEVASSTFDEPVEDHTRVAEMAFERARRLVEGGKDVVILMDSITRATRAYNLALPPAAAPSPAASIPSPSIPPSASSAPPASARRAAPSPSSPPASSIPAAVWTKSSSKSSRAPETWNCASTASSPSAASIPPSISRPAPPAARNSCSMKPPSRASGSSVA